MGGHFTWTCDQKSLQKSGIKRGMTCVGEWGGGWVIVHGHMTGTVYRKVVFREGWHVEGGHFTWTCD